MLREYAEPNSRELCHTVSVTFASISGCRERKGLSARERKGLSAS